MAKGDAKKKREEAEKNQRKEARGKIVRAALEKLQEPPFRPEDCLLSDLGMKQTGFKKTRQPEHMKWKDGKGPDVIYCSPMRRCVLTAVEEKFGKIFGHLHEPWELMR